MLELKNTLMKMLINKRLGTDYPKQLENRYLQIITLGAWGEIGHNYYLFIYRNVFSKNLTYEAVIFIYTPFDLEKSIQLIVTDQNSVQSRINEFIDTAIYFLKKKLPNTLHLGEEIKGFYDKVKKIIQDYNKAEEVKKKEFESFNFDIRGQEIKVSKLQLKTPVMVANPYITNKIQLLKTAVKCEGKGRHSLNENKRSPGRLGLCLEVPGDKYTNKHFLPVVLPIKKNGTYGTARVTQSNPVEKFIFDDSAEPGLLIEYMENLYLHYFNGSIKPAFQEALDSLYFEKLARLFMEMPDELTFYREHNTDDKKLSTLKKLLFKKLDVFFIPSTDGDQLRIFMKVTTSDGRILEPGLKFKVVADDDKHAYLFFKIPGGETKDNTSCEEEAYFAAPEEPGKLSAFLRFIDDVIPISNNNFKEVCDALWDIRSDALVIHPEPIPLYCLEYCPIPVLKIRDEIKYSDLPKRIEITFDYNSGLQEFLAEHSGQILVHYPPNTHFEDMCFLLLKTDPLLTIGEKMGNHWEANEDRKKFFFSFHDNNDIRWLVERGMFYLEKGFKIYSDKWKQYVGKTFSRLQFEIRPGICWLEFKPTLKDEVTGKITALGKLDLHNEMVNDKNGKLHLLKKEDIERLARFYKYAEPHGDVFRIPSENYFLINELYDKRMEEIPLLKARLNLAQNLKSFKNKKIPSYRLAKGFNGQLRKYQEAGFQWMYFLREYKLSGCLADDMGLGKTIQTLALLQTLKERKKLSTSLLVVPLSAISNWETEIGNFTPQLTAYRHLGNVRAKEFDEWYEYDLIVTSYATLRKDIELFKEFTFDYIILDESQNIKNFTSQISRAVKILKGNNRLALSGTPIENNSMELWSLFDFLLPGFFGTHNWFKKQWVIPVERDKEKEKIELLKKMVYPFILRRKKEQVEKELPAKTEIINLLQMEEKQMKLYASVATYYRNLIGREVRENGLQKSTFKILEGVLRLRQICLCPRLVDEKYIDIPSVKVDHFVSLLEDILAVKHKVLIFSQFVKMLDILKNHFDQKNIKYSYLDGSVSLKNREQNVKDFQEKDDIQVFLLSLKAGGVSLNLTAADYVIIFDSWWNPAVEAQAIDRSHRIGQTKKVIVYRMIVKNSIEEKMLALQDKKKHLLDQLIASDGQSLKDFSLEDIFDLFKF